MPQITKISSQKRKKRVNVYLDDQFAFGLDLETLAKHDLHVGQRLSQEKIEEILKEGEFQKVYDKVLKFLSFRPRSEKEVEDYLEKKGAGEEIKRMVKEKLRKIGLLDDKDFALWWIEQRILFRPKGRRLLEKELSKKGIGKEIIDRVLEKKLGGLVEQRLALKAAKQKLSIYQKLPPLKFRQKMGEFLARRGFSWETIRKVVERLTP